MQTGSNWLRLAAGAAVLAGSGCSATDPYERSGTWRPSGSNPANLAVMVAVPSDLVYGVGDGLSNGQQAAAALDRLRTDKVKALPNSGASQIVLAPSGAQSSSASAPNP